MIRIPALPAVILAITSLAGCQVLTTPVAPPEDQATTQAETEESQQEQPQEVAESEQDQVVAPVKPKEEPKASLQQNVVQKPAYIDGKLVVGFAEKGLLPDYGLELNAKIDTGAARTSIDARNAQPFERDGKRWVSFEVQRTYKGAVSMELPIVETVLVKRPNEESLERYVVAFTVKIGNITRQLDISLNDRATFDFPLLIGRDFLRDMAIVDVSKNYIALDKTLETVTRQVSQQEHKAAQLVIERPVNLGNLPILGALETIQLAAAPQRNFKARIDTGAVTSSLDARDLEIFQKDGDEWVRFKLASDEEEAIIERPVSRTVLIKRHGLPSERRRVISLDITVGKITKAAEFTLRDRSEYEYPVLIGEYFLEETAMVDVSQEYTTRKNVKP